MRQSIRLGRVAGIPVGANWTVAVVLALIAYLLGASELPAAVPHQRAVVYWLIAVGAAVVFLASLLAHELSHSVVAKHNGVQVRSITLAWFGGVSELAGDPPNPGADLRIALAGPGASLAAGILLGGLAVAIGAGGGPAAAVAATEWLAVMNGLLAVFNMLPGAPLDGGRVLRAILWRHYRDRVRAAVAATRAGGVLGIVIILAGLAELVAWLNVGGLWLMVIGWFLVSAARAEQVATLSGSALAGLRVADVMTPDPEIALGWNTVQEFADRVAAHSRQGAFPVLGFDGRLAGVVLTEAIARMRPADRAALRVDQVAIGVPAEYLAAPGDPAGSLLTRPPLRGEVSAVVFDDGRLVGMVTAADLGHALRRARLRSGPQASMLTAGSR
jgi:Zn-dependent protease